MSALIDNYSLTDLEIIIKNSKSFSEVANKLGYTNLSGNLPTLRKRIEEYNIDTSHFSGRVVIQTKRNEENVFIENSTASQATLRRWYKKGEYTEYKCSICGQLPIWQEKKLTLILDHIDGNNHNNKLENLRWVCPNCNQQLDTTGFKQMRSKAVFIQQYCCDCGKPISKSAIRCIDCNEKQRKNNSKINQTTREELKILIRTKPFTQIAKQFNVSDNTIRKWCVYYNLPSKATQIKKISDEEWIKI